MKNAEMRFTQTKLSCRFEKLLAFTTEQGSLHSFFDFQAFLQMIFEACLREPQRTNKVKKVKTIFSVK